MFRFWFCFILILSKAMKRESGENPEQTRCCNLRRSLQFYFATGFKLPGRPIEDGVSQKTCLNHLFEAFGEIKLKIQEYLWLIMSHIWLCISVLFHLSFSER